MRRTLRRTPLKRMPARSAALVLASAIAASATILLAGCGTRGPLVLPPKPGATANLPAKPATLPAKTSGVNTPDNPSTQTNPAETAR